MSPDEPRMVPGLIRASSLTPPWVIQGSTGYSGAKPWSSVANPCSVGHPQLFRGSFWSIPGVIRELSGARTWLVRDQHSTDESRITRLSPGRAPDGSSGSQSGARAGCIKHFNTSEPGSAKDQPGSPRTEPDEPRMSPGSTIIPLDPPWRAVYFILLHMVQSAKCLEVGDWYTHLLHIVVIIGKRWQMWWKRKEQWQHTHWSCQALMCVGGIRNKLSPNFLMPGI